MKKYLKKEYYNKLVNIQKILNEYKNDNLLSYAINLLNDVLNALKEKKK